MPYHWLLHFRIVLSCKLTMLNNTPDTIVMYVSFKLDSTLRRVYKRVDSTILDSLPPGGDGKLLRHYLRISCIYDGHVEIFCTWKHHVVIDKMETRLLSSSEGWGKANSLLIVYRWVIEKKRLKWIAYMNCKGWCLGVKTIPILEVKIDMYKRKWAKSLICYLYY